MKKLAKEGRVIGTDIKEAMSNFPKSVTFDHCDVTDSKAVKHVFEKYRPTHVIHLSAILSGAGEKNPELAKRVNLGGFQNVLESSTVLGAAIFSPSTIAAFGPETPKRKTPDVTVMRPSTIYGISKVHMELMGEYWSRRYGVDFRSIRLPGVISPEPIHGMGTTDYAVEMFQGLEKGHKTMYTCYLKPDTRLPMVYIDDCLKAIIKLIHADNTALAQRVYNINGLDFTPEELAAAIRDANFDFTVQYKPDFRQPIADSWPQSLKDTPARKDWAWRPSVNTLAKLVAKMTSNMSSK